LHLQQALPLLCLKPYKHPKTTKLNLNITKEDDGNKLPLFFSLKHHHKKRQRHIVVVFFFSNIENTKHIRKQQKETKRRKGAYLQTPGLLSHFWLLLLPSRFCTSISSAFS